MTAKELCDTITDSYCDVIFSYNGLRSGIEPEVHKSIPIFHVWHGEDAKDYSDINTLISDKFFSGKSLNEIAEKVKFTFM